MASENRNRLVIICKGEKKWMNKSSISKLRMVTGT